MTDKQHAKKTLPVLIALIVAVGIIWLLPGVPEGVKYALSAVALVFATVKLFRR